MSKTTGIRILRLTNLAKAADALFGECLIFHPDDHARFKAALDASLEDAARDLHGHFFPAEEPPPGGPFDSVARNDRPVEPNPNAPHIVIHPGEHSFTLNVGESGAWVSFAEQAEDAEPEYDTVSQDDIRQGDVVEYAHDNGVNRWVVLSRELILSDGQCEVQMQLLDGPINAVETVRLPLRFDPVIRRYRRRS